MTRIFIATIALSLCATAANATTHKRKHVRHHGPAMAYVPVAPADPYAAYYRPGPRPIWGAPQQCFTDEGYGRYWPCGAGANGR